MLQVINSNLFTAVNNANDRENSKTELLQPTVINPSSPSLLHSGQPQHQDWPYYLYRSDPQYPPPQGNAYGVSLLAAAAVVASNEDYQPSHLAQSPESYQAYGSMPQIYPHTMRHAENDPSFSASLICMPGNDARRRVEAALEAVEEERQRGQYAIRVEREPILTPPCSNPVSPAPSPDPLDLAMTPREVLILPPRKRSKMILESMEIERNNPALRQNSVIKFARAS